MFSNVLKNELTLLCFLLIIVVCRLKVLHSKFALVSWFLSLFTEEKLHYRGGSALVARDQ